MPHYSKAPVPPPKRQIQLYLYSSTFFARRQLLCCVPDPNSSKVTSWLISRLVKKSSSAPPPSPCPLKQANLWIAGSVSHPGAAPVICERFKKLGCEAGPLPFPCAPGLIRKGFKLSKHNDFPAIFSSKQFVLELTLQPQGTVIYATVFY